MSKGPWKKPATNLGLFAIPVAIAAMTIGGMISIGANVAYLMWPEIAPKTTERKSSRFLANQKTD